MSAVPSIATRMLQCHERSDVPIATDAPQQLASLFDHLVGELLELQGHVEAKRLCGLKVDDQLKLGRLHHRQICGTGALKNFTDMDTGLAMRISDASAVAHQAASRNELAQLINRGDRVLSSDWRRGRGRQPNFW